MTIDWGLLGAPQFGLRDCKVARWLGGGSYGPSVDVPSVQLMGLNVQTTNAILTGDDEETDAHSKAIAAQVQVRFGSVALPVLAVLTNQDIVETGSGDDEYHTWDFVSDNFPYFGIAGTIEPTSGDGSRVLFVPKVKIMEGFQMQHEYGAYAIPDLTCRAIPDETFDPSGASEVQTLTITGTPTGGNFTLTFRGQETANIAYNANAAAVTSALEALSTIGAGNVLCSGGALPGTPVVITFQGDLAYLPLPLITTDDSGLTGGTAPEAAVVQTTNGVVQKRKIFRIRDYAWYQPALIPPA